MSTEKLFASLGALLALLAVTLGAFGAHALKSRLSPELLQTFETGVTYQMYHALGLFAVAWAYSRFSSPFVQASGWFMLAGTVVFSGSLYLLAMTDWRWLGAVTPVGGLGMILGWALLGWGVRAGGLAASR